MVVVWLCSVSTALAHVTLADGTISVLLHMDPDDDPIAGEPAFLHLGFSDTAKSFTPALCDCTLVISKGGQTIFTKKLFADDTEKKFTTATASFIFPEPAVYAVRVTGTPTASNMFQPFAMEDSVRVERETLAATSSSSGMGMLYQNLASSGALFVLILIAIIIPFSIYFRKLSK